VWCKTWSNWTSRVGQKNPTPTPSVVGGLTPPKNLQLCNPAMHYRDRTTNCAHYCNIHTCANNAASDVIYCLNFHVSFCKTLADWKLPWANANIQAMYVYFDFGNWSKGMLFSIVPQVNLHDVKDQSWAWCLKCNFKL